MKTVLLVDDDEDFRDIVKYVLEQGGFRVLTAASGQDAVNVARQDPPDLVLMDLLMPGRDGAATVTYMKNITQYAHIPVVFMSGVVGDSPSGEGSVLVVDGQEYPAIAKTIGKDQIVKRVREILA